jgi:uncharacterized membrane protein YdbT with pleckstrin-like domain
MSTPTELTGEEILWQGTVSHWHFIGRWLLVLLCVAGLVATFAFPMNDAWLRERGLASYGISESAVWILRGVLLVAGLIVILSISVTRARRKYSISNKRVSMEIGLVSKDSNEIRLEHIRSINLTTEGLLGILGVGRLEFSSAATDDAEVVFWNVGGAARLRDLVRSLETKAA